MKPFSAVLVLTSALSTLSWSYAARSSEATAAVGAQRMKVTYHAEAKRERAGDQPMWEGEAPCSQYPTEGESVLRLTRDGFDPPRLKERSPADYSALKGKLQAFEGIFLAEVVVGSSGRVAAVHVLRSVAPEYDELVLRELESSRYEPATREGSPVSVCIAYMSYPHP